MARKEIWSNVKIDISSALAAAITISSITLGATTTVAYTGTDPANGDEVLLSIVGIPELDGKVYRVASVDTGANTFVLEGLNSTGFDPFVSGSFQKVTGWSASNIITSVNASGGEAKMVSTTTVHDKVESEMPTVLSPMKMDFDAHFKLGDAFLAEAIKASNASEIRVVRIRFPSGTRMLGSAYVAASGMPTGQAQDLAKTKMSFSFQGLPTLYAN
jgi:hypothetical protein